MNKVKNKNESKKYLKTKIACYSSNMSMSVVGNLSPLLFLTFREIYGISYSLLGLLVLVNFSTQLIVDLIFSFFSHKFNIKTTVRVMPFLGFLGLVIYALAPVLFENNVYLGLCISTVIFSASSGLGEVLISPVIAALPSDNPDREMSKLHSIYAWGVVACVLFATVFLWMFGNENWQILVFILSLVPLVSGFLFMTADIPDMETPEKVSGAFGVLKNKTVWISIFAIFLGGAAECTMAQWASGYLEKSVGIPKLWGDVFGVALFAATLGLGRTLYSKIGKNIKRVLTWGSLGAALCYFLAAISPFPVVGLLACAVTGFCVSMLWPGNLIDVTDKFHGGGVVIFALMAAGGDLGASAGPQLVGVITDLSMESEKISSLLSSFGLSAEQGGMKLGMLVGMLFPLVSFFLHLWERNKKK